MKKRTVSGRLLSRASVYHFDGGEYGDGIEVDDGPCPIFSAVGGAETNGPGGRK